MNVNQFVSSFEIVFFDFDGTIKQSEKIKSQVFYDLFSPYGKNIALKAVSHHERNGGVSRFEKIPLYLKWAGCEVRPELVNQYASKFRNIAFNKIIDSEWVMPVKSYMDRFHNKQIFALLSAMPDEELKEIIVEIKIDDYFNVVSGYPNDKSKSIKEILCKYGLLPTDAVMIGDSLSDYKASQENSISFVMHPTDLNIDINYKGMVI